MKILAVGAHPDDVEFGCAPLLLQEVRNGNQVRILVLSRGEAASSGTPEGRERESRAAAAILGAEIDFLDLGGDCRIQYSSANSALMARQIRSFQPQIVLAPTLGENQHPDHAAAGKMVRDASRLARFGGLKELLDLPPHAVDSLFYYSITQVFGDPPDVVVDVTPVHAKWVEAMECHQSQMATRSYLDLVNARAAATGSAIGVKFAVGLWANDPIRLESLGMLTLSARHY